MTREAICFTIALFTQHQIGKYCAPARGIQEYHHLFPAYNNKY